MVDPEIEDYSASMENSNELESRNICAANVACKPIIVRGLIYRAIIEGGFLHSMVTNNQLPRVRINKIIKYYKDQRESQLKANISTAKMLTVPSEEFIGWMKHGCIDNETYLVLRNCVLKKSYRKKMALMKDLDEAKAMLSSVGVATSQLIMNVDLKEFTLTFPQESKPVCSEQVLKSVEPTVSKSESLLKFFLGQLDNPSPLKQGVCGIMFGLFAAKVICFLLPRIRPNS